MYVRMSLCHLGVPEYFSMLDCSICTGHDTLVILLCTTATIKVVSFFNGTILQFVFHDLQAFLFYYLKEETFFLQCS